MQFAKALLKNIKKKKINNFKVKYLSKKLKNLKFILSKIKYRFFFNKHFPISLSKFKIFHNKIFYVNILSLKNFLIKSQRDFTRAVELIDNHIFFRKNLYLKKKLYLKKNKKKQKYALTCSSYFTLYNKLLSFTFRFGKKTSWDLALNNLFENLYYTINFTISTVLAKIFIRLYTKVELVKATSRKRTTFIPFFINLNRSIFLALKWIFLGAFKNNNNTSLKNKLYVEFVQLLTYKSCFSIQKLEENNTNSFKNRSNIHFRWKK